MSIIVQKQTEEHTEIILNLGDWRPEEAGCSYTWLTEKTWKNHLF